ncbi:MAG: RDD family protein [Actinomycetes bacterium]
MSSNAATPPSAYGGGLVTGDAVVVELRLAKLPSRAFAFFIDAAIQLGLFFGLVFLTIAVSGAIDSTLLGVFVFVGIVAIVVGYPVTMESLTRGRTVGKLALGLRVVRDDGGAERFRHALVRGLMGVVELYLLSFIAILTSLGSAEGKRVGDYLAGTVVLRERAPSGGHPLPEMDPRLAGWAATLDLSRLPDDLVLSARQFLGRAAQLTPAARNELGRAIAHDVARVVTPAPPPKLPPEPYLQTVLAERRRRSMDAIPTARSTPAPPWATAPSPAVDVDPAAGFAPPDIAPPA